ncbi:hypothetical protein, partial [Streptomyces niveiscabiei]|uniref:hypothetical protein n=1 Tax=Streptomyces niveiscabiei TaxID=164115 RepID=UPI0038F79156
DNRRSAAGTNLLEGGFELLSNLWGIRGAGQQNELGLRIKLSSGMHQVDQSFLSCNAPDEDHRRSVRVHPDVTAHIGLGDGMEL